MVTHCNAQQQYGVEITEHNLSPANTYTVSRIAISNNYNSYSPFPEEFKAKLDGALCKWKVFLPMAGQLELDYLCNPF